MNATRFFNNLNPPDNSMKKASATSKWEITLTDEERKLICNSGKWFYLQGRCLWWQGTGESTSIMAFYS